MVVSLRDCFVGCYCILLAMTRVKAMTGVKAMTVGAMTGGFKAFLQICRRSALCLLGRGLLRDGIGMRSMGVFCVLFLPLCRRLCFLTILSSFCLGFFHLLRSRDFGWLCSILLFRCLCMVGFELCVQILVCMFLLLMRAPLFGTLNIFRKSVF